MAAGAKWRMPLWGVVAAMVVCVALAVHFHRSAEYWSRVLLFGAPPAEWAEARERQSWYWFGFFAASAASLVLAVVALTKVRRPPKAAGRFCPCGYDLRATPDRCPECGRAA